MARRPAVAETRWASPSVPGTRTAPRWARPRRGWPIREGGASRGAQRARRPRCGIPTRYALPGA
eukprot:10442797-Alexandrium_andersonii.AAC.1